jgi:NO-binding membrane sensor protein with MHYT domain
MINSVQDDIFFFVLSFMVAFLGAFSAFGVVKRTDFTTRGSLKILYNILGALTMGIGFWAMHFVGILSLIFPIYYGYDPQLVILSIFLSITTCSLFLWIMTLKYIGNFQLLLGGLLLGLGNSSVSYVGMSACRQQD